MKLRSKVDGNIIDVPSEHAINVLLPQGKYEEIKETVVAEQLPQNMIVETGYKKKPGRPKKVV